MYTDAQLINNLVESSWQVFVCIVAHLDRDINTCADEILLKMSDVLSFFEIGSHTETSTPFDRAVSELVPLQYLDSIIPWFVSSGRRLDRPKIKKDFVDLSSKFTRYTTRSKGATIITLEDEAVQRLFFLHKKVSFVSKVFEGEL